MKVKFSRCNSNSLANVPQVDGQLIYVKDTSEVYMDVGNNRNKLSDVIEVADITNVQNPIISKIYYDEATENLYKYIDNEWKSLGGSATPQIYFWDGNQQTGLTFWNNIMKVNEDNDVVVLYTFSDFSLSTIIKIPQGTIKTKKVTNWYDYYDLASNSSNVTYSAMKARIKFIIENDVIITYTIETTTVASMSVLETNKDYATPYVPLYDGSPANKKYVDDKCIPYQPFPSGLDTSHTTQAFITSIKALNLPAGSTYLGGVTLTDMPFNGNAEVEIYVYPNNVVYCILRSANVAPYEWECNSHTFRGWEAVGKAYTDNALTNYVQNIDYATNNKAGVIKSGFQALVNNQGQIYASSANYETYQTWNNNQFVGKGTLENVIDNSVLLKGSTVPTTSTVGYRIGQLYLNTTTGKVYQLASIDDTNPNNKVYTWQQLIRFADLVSYTPASSSTTFDNTGTGLQATNVQDAIEELLGKLNDLETAVGQVDEILDEIIGEDTDITDVVYTANNFTLNSETGYYEMSGATATSTNLEISFTKATAGNVVLSYKGNKITGMESYTTIQLDDGDTDGLSSSVEYTNYVLENVSAGSHTIRVEISSGDPSTSLSIKLVV